MEMRAQEQGGSRGGGRAQLQGRVSKTRAGSACWQMGRGGREGAVEAGSRACAPKGGHASS